MCVNIYTQSFPQVYLNLVNGVDKKQKTVSFAFYLLPAFFE